MKNTGIFISLCFLTFSSLMGQDTLKHYYPKGDPKKWNVEMTPFLWLPFIKGDITLGKLEQSFELKPIDLLKNLRGAFLFSFDVSRGRFVSGASYTFMKLGTEKVIWQNRSGEDVLVAVPELPMHLLNYYAGTRVRVGNKVLIDPFVGFRYVNIQPSVKLDNQVTLNTSTLEAKIDFWDPILGFKINYFPHPRVPLTLYTDIGGFTAGSKISWNSWVRAGYSVCPMLDLFAGFHAFGFNYEQLTGNDRNSSLKTTLFGFEMGATLMLPKRYRDPALYKEKKKKSKQDKTAS